MIGLITQSLLTTFFFELIGLVIKHFVFWIHSHPLLDFAKLADKQGFISYVLIKQVFNLPFGQAQQYA